MAQSHWENNLLHLFLKHLPDSEVFRKQKEWVSNYLSELLNRGANTRADLTNLKDTFKGSRRSFAKIINQPHSQLTTETEELNRMRNKKLDVEYVTSMDTQKKIVSNHAGIANSQDIAIEIVLKEGREEEAKAEEEKEEETTQLPNKEDSHLKEENIPLIQKEKERRKKK